MSEETGRERNKVDDYWWGWRWNGYRPRNDVYLHHSITGSYIIKVGSLNYSDPIFEGNYDEVVSYLQSSDKEYAPELLQALIDSQEQDK